MPTTLATPLTDALRDKLSLPQASMMSVTEFSLFDHARQLEQKLVAMTADRDMWLKDDVKQNSALGLVISERDRLKQEIRDLFARYGSGNYTPSEEEKAIIETSLDEILTPQPVAQSESAGSEETTHPNGLWVVWYEDPAKQHEVFFGEGAEDAARARYKSAYDNWSCHLLRRVPHGK